MLIVHFFQHLSRNGIKVNLRETERKRRSDHSRKIDDDDDDGDDFRYETGSPEDDK